MGEVLNELNSDERDFFVETTVAQVVVRYNLLAVPVLDDTAGLVGIVTIDDVVDVIREENTEDVLKMAGTGTLISPPNLCSEIPVHASLGCSQVSPED